MRLLIAEDDPALRGLLARRLTQEGYAVDAYEDGADALTAALGAQYDIMLLDIMLPGLDGLSLLRMLRSRGVIAPVMMLTARGAVEDRVEGLDLGADDYLVKPFAYEELLARIRALLRKHTQNKTVRLTCSDLVMDTVAHTVVRGERAIRLTAKEYALLEYLLRNAGQVLTRDQISSHVWNYDCGYETNLVDVYIGYLRTKIDKGESVRLLHTVRGFGYTLRAEAQP